MHSICVFALDVTERWVVCTALLCGVDMVNIYSPDIEYEQADTQAWE